VENELKNMCIVKFKILKRRNTLPHDHERNEFGENALAYQQNKVGNRKKKGVSKKIY